jgi:hypothetical protein
VDTSTGFDAPAVFPSNGAMTWRPLLSTRSLGRFPRFGDTTGRSDSPPSDSTRFEFFTSRYHRFARGLLPSVVGVQYCSAQGLLQAGAILVIEHECN